MLSDMLKKTGDYPFAQVDAEDRYLQVSRGWARTYSPGIGTDWWVGKSHIRAFRLESFPHWMQSYQNAKDGVPELKVELLDLPGVDGPTVSAWMLNPDGSGGVFIVVLPLDDVLAAARIQATHQGIRVPLVEG